MLTDAEKDFIRASFARYGTESLRHWFPSVPTAIKDFPTKSALFLRRNVPLPSPVNDGLKELFTVMAEAGHIEFDGERVYMKPKKG